MKLSLIKNDRQSKTRKNRISRISYWTRLLGLSTVLSVFSANQALSTYPSLYPTTALLNSNYAQCKAKVNEVANLVFSEVHPMPEENGYFLLFGRTPRSTSSLMCIESDRGTYFILSTSNDSFADINNEGESIYQRINQYMLNN